jgi:hypothetical protein
VHRYDTYDRQRTVVLSSEFRSFSSSACSAVKMKPFRGAAACAGIGSHMALKLLL